MAIEQWLPGFVFAFTLVHLGLAYVTYRRLRRQTEAGGSDRPASDGRPGGHDGGVVACPECETENERGYRYCRACVTELPGAMEFAHDDEVPVGRLPG